MAIYRELVFNNLESLLGGNFPVVREVLGDEHWALLVRGFFVHHRCTTPLFHELGQEFLTYLQRRGEAAGDPPFLLELAHYEWVELALDIAEDGMDLAEVDPNGDLLAVSPWSRRSLGPSATASRFTASDPASSPRNLTLSPRAWWSTAPARGRWSSWRSTPSPHACWRSWIRTPQAPAGRP
jgi:hypothetical protein